MFAPMPLLSIVVCTYNRAELLEFCLGSLSDQLSAYTNDAVEVIVVNNNCTDNTSSVVGKANARCAAIREVVELNQGLSCARNRGIEEAKAEWVFFLDDDALAGADMIQRALEWIAKPGIQVFGGKYVPWYHYGSTKWFKDEYASTPLPYVEALSLKKSHEFLTGGILCIHKDLFQRFGLFNPEIGMIGNQVGFGEETELMRTYRSHGIDLWYDPLLVIRHVVKPQLLDPSWHIRAGWALGRDRVIAGSTRNGALYMAGVVLVLIGLTALDGVRNAVRAVLNPTFYRENWWIETFRKAAKRSAIVYYTSLGKSTASE
jgi:glycosyltransferase involved in cell wall biosynthesis